MSEDSAPPRSLVWQLDQFSRRFADAKDVVELAAVAADLADRLISVEYTGFYFREPDTGRLRLLSAKGFTEEERLAAEATAEERHPGFVLRTGEVLHVPDTDADPERRTIDSPRSFKVRSRFYIPVIAFGRVIGTLGLAASRPNAFSEQTVGLMSFVASLAGLAYARIAAQHEAQRIESSFRTLADSAPIAAIVLDAEGRVEFFNRAAERLTRFSVAEVLGRQVLDRFSPLLAETVRERLAREVDEPVSNGEAGALEFSLRTREGREVPVRGFLRVIARVPTRRLALLIVGSRTLAHGALEGYRAIWEAEVASRGRLLEERTLELQRTVERVRKVLNSTVETLASVVETRDLYTAGHQRRVAGLARAIATMLQLPADRVEGLRMAGMIHDIGKVGIPAEILSKPGRLCEIEFRLIQTHVQVGYEILKQIDFPWPVAEIVYQHHERMDGSGYPRGLRGERILLEARILGVADVVEAMASHRPYRPALGLDAAIAELESHPERFDRDVVAACTHLVRVQKFAF